MTENTMDKTRYQVLSGSSLKVIAVLSMLCDHAAKYWLAPMGLLNKPAYIVMSLIIGRIAFPLFAFLLVEGYLHTRNIKRYTLNLAFFALLTTIPWNLVHGGLFSFVKCNVLFTLLLGLLAIYGIDRLHGRKGLLCVMASLALAYILHTDYNIHGILTIILLYGFRSRREYQCLSSFACLFHGKSTLGLPLALIPMYMYNGKRGFIKGRTWKYAFYLIYPLHLMLFYILTQI